MIIKEIKQVVYIDKFGYEEVRYIEIKRKVKIKNKADTKNFKERKII